MNIDVIGVSEARDWRGQILGTIGQLSIFVWFLAMVMLVSRTKILAITLICLLVAVVIYPFSFRNALRWRWLVLMLLLSAPAVFLLGEMDAEFYGITYSSEGLLAGLQIAARFVVVLIAVEAFTGAVGITAIAGLMERFGMQGLGFSIGVALNLLPGLQNACIQTWWSMRMRGGLRKNWLRGLRLMSMTILSNAIRRAEEVSLAADARAFSPDESRPLPIRKGQLDWLPFAIGLPTIVIMLII